MTDDELIAVEHANWIGYVTGVIACSGGAPVSRFGGVVSVLTGLPMDWFSQVLIEDGRATVDGVRAAVAHAREQSRPFVVRLRIGPDDRFVATLTETGLVLADGTTPGMVAYPIDHDAIAAAASPGFEIRAITDAAGIEDHQRVVTAGFGTEPEVAAGTSCLALVERPGCAVYVGYADGHPVVSGLRWQTGRTVGVYSIATVASARRRGYGAAMSARIVADGVADGCDVAILQASEMGRPIYERLGFRTVVRYSAYTE